MIDDKTKVVICTESDKIVVKRAKKRRNIKELFADFHGKYIPIEVNWDASVGEERW